MGVSGEKILWGKIISKLKIKLEIHISLTFSPFDFSSEACFNYDPSLWRKGERKSENMSEHSEQTLTFLPKCWGFYNYAKKCSYSLSHFVPVKHSHLNTIC